MLETHSRGHVFVSKKRGTEADEFEGDDVFVAKKSMLPSLATENDPATTLASARHEFGEHRGECCIRGRRRWIQHHTG
ncbi:hypothetical protein V6N13_123686 [Hibiscus sabdariffa]